MNALPSNAYAARFVVLPSGVDADAASHPSEVSWFKINVERRAPGAYVVCRNGGDVLGHDGRWEYERRLGDEDEHKIATQRFHLDAALAKAVEHVDRITINGMTFVQIQKFGALPVEEREAFRAACWEQNKTYFEATKEI